MGDQQTPTKRLKDNDVRTIILFDRRSYDVSRDDHMQQLGEAVAEVEGAYDAAITRLDGVIERLRTVARQHVERMARDGLAVPLRSAPLSHDNLRHLQAQTETEVRRTSSTANDADSAVKDEENTPEQGPSRVRQGTYTPPSDAIVEPAGLSSHAQERGGVQQEQSPDERGEGHDEQSARRSRPSSARDATVVHIERSAGIEGSSEEGANNETTGAQPAPHQREEEDEVLESLELLGNQAHTLSRRSLPPSASATGRLLLPDPMGDSDQWPDPEVLRVLDTPLPPMITRGGFEYIQPPVPQGPSHDGNHHASVHQFPHWPLTFPSQTAHLLPEAVAPDGGHPGYTFVPLVPPMLAPYVSSEDASEGVWVANNVEQQGEPTVGRRQPSHQSAYLTPIPDPPNDRHAEVAPSDTRNHMPGELRRDSSISESDPLHPFVIEKVVTFDAGDREESDLSDAEHARLPSERGPLEHPRQATPGPSNPQTNQRRLDTRGAEERVEDDPSVRGRPVATRSKRRRAEDDEQNEDESPAPKRPRRRGDSEQRAEEAALTLASLRTGPAMNTRSGRNAHNATPLGGDAPGALAVPSTTSLPGDGGDEAENQSTSAGRQDEEIHDEQQLKEESEQEREAGPSRRGASRRAATAPPKPKGRRGATKSTYSKSRNDKDDNNGSGRGRDKAR